MKKPFACLRYLLGGLCPIETVYLRLSLGLSWHKVRILSLPEWYLTDGSSPPEGGLFAFYLSCAGKAQSQSHGTVKLPRVFLSRTVIVTTPFIGASVACFPVIRLLTFLTFWHWAGVNPHTWSYDFAETCVFGKQSPGLVTATPFVRRHSFSRSYGAILPSSLERVILCP
ncbi:hypothetical protein KIW84_045709 [Lathyrus oleraceus]|uniref:Uncharacterized protein n=1 Tax=Pisum sativum TaxID=3888 RepID=A0A9D4XLS8_PEA|nr:hypothetical protein KIW84_045709 [Pisum sativum]